jgi:hypothetical protein
VGSVTEAEEGAIVMIDANAAITLIAQAGAVIIKPHNKYSF